MMAIVEGGVKKDFAPADLVLAWQTGDRKAGGALVRVNAPIVECIARRWARWCGDDVEDLRQEAAMGLLHGFRRFDRAKQKKDGTASYAIAWANSHAREHAKLRSRIVRSPIGARASRLNAPSWALKREASPNELRALGLARIDDRRSEGWFERFAAPDDEDARRSQLAMSSVVEEVLVKVGCGGLILRRRFGIGGRRRETLREIGDDFGVTKECVRLWERDVLERARKAAASIGFRSIADVLEVA